ncbi:MAG: S-layer homology domain-containing protein [Clostridiales Family XIII bacterium]|jgi:hypothetical protein|nr:S-layer homology domain-containing protein [Clostridiales Family XIII bacterium]
MKNKSNAFGGVKGPPGILRKLMAVLLSLALVVGALPLSASADTVDDIAAAVENILNRAAKFDEPISNGGFDGDYTYFALWLLSEYEYTGAASANYGKLVINATGKLDVGVTNLDYAKAGNVSGLLNTLNSGLMFDPARTKTKLNDLLTGSSVAALPYGAKSLILDFIVALSGKEYWGTDFAGAVGAFLLSNDHRRGLATLLQDVRNALDASLTGVVAGKTTSYTGAEISFVGIDKYLLTGLKSSVNGNPEIPYDLVVKDECVIDLDDLLGALRTGSADATALTEGVKLLNAVNAIVDQAKAKTSIQKLFGTDRTLADVAIDYVEEVLDDQSEFAKLVDPLITLAFAGSTTIEKKAALLAILEQYEILVYDDSHANIIDVNLGKVLGMLGIDKEKAETWLNGVFSKTINKLIYLAELLQKENLDLDTLDKEAQDIIEGIEAAIKGAIALLPNDSSSTDPGTATPMALENDLEPLLRFAKDVVKDLLDKANGKDYEWLEKYAAEVQDAFSSGDVSAFANYTIAGYKIGDYEEEIETAIKLIQFVYKELKERDVDFLDPNSDPIGNLQELINDYLDPEIYDTAAARDGIEEKIPTVLGLLEEHFGLTPDKISEIVASAAQSYLTKAGLPPSIAGAIDEDLMKDLVFNVTDASKPNLSPTGLTLVASVYVKAIKFLNKGGGTSSGLDKLPTLFDYAGGAYNNLAYIAGYIDKHDRVTIDVNYLSGGDAASPYAKLTNDYDPLLYGNPDGSTDTSKKGYAKFLQNLGFTFQYTIKSVTPNSTDETPGTPLEPKDFPFRIVGNKILGIDTTPVEPGKTYTLVVQAQAFFAYKSVNSVFTFADATVEIDVPALVDAATPVISGQPIGASYFVGDVAAPLTVTASLPGGDSSGTLSYQWYSSTAPDGPGIEIADAANASSYTPPTDTPGTVYYYVVVTNTKNDATGEKTASVTSDAAAVEVIAKNYAINWKIFDSNDASEYTFPSRTKGYADEDRPMLTVTVTNGGNVDTGPLTLTLSGADESAFVVSPPKFNSIATSGAIEPAVKSATFTLTPAIGLQPGTYTATLTLSGRDGTNIHKSLTVSFTVRPPVEPPVEPVDPPVDPVNAATPSITVQPANATYTAGVAAVPLTVTAKVEDGGTLSYQWYAGGTPIGGATGESYTPPTATAGTFVYYVVVTNTIDTVEGAKTATATSASATVTVTAAASEPSGPPSGPPSSSTSSGGTPAAETEIEEEETPLATIDDGKTPLAAFVAERVAYIAGYPDDTVRPDGGLTRAEVAAMLFRLISDADKDDPRTPAFTDVEEGKWYAQSIAYLAELGILNGYADGSFKPSAEITRAEFAAILSRFDASQGAAGEAVFSDVPQSHWAFDEIANAAEKGWVNGYPDGTFKPQITITRAEAVTAINNALRRELTAADIPADAPHFVDLPESHWAYADIVEAAYDWAAAAKAEAAETEAPEAEAESETETTDR